MGVIRRLLSNQSEQAGPASDFVLHDDEIGHVNMSDDFLEREDGDYELSIQDRQQFETVVRCINASSSFRAVTRLFVIFGEAIGSMKLGKPSEQSVGRYVRYVVAINLSAISAILSAVWSFSILVDGATHRSQGYLDVRVGFTVDRAIFNVHLFAIPMGKLAHTASNYADLVLHVLDSVGGETVLRKLIGITSDGAATMLGCRQGFAVRIRRACEQHGGTGIAVHWCGSHQLNLVVGSLLDQLDELVSFRTCLGAEISFTRTHESVRASVGQCPTYATTRWESIHDACQFLAMNNEPLLQHQVEKRCSHSNDAWWLCLFVVADIAEYIRHCMKTMQYKAVTMQGQYRALDNLIRTLQLKYEGDADSGMPNEPTVSLDRVIHHIRSASFYSVRLYDGLDDETLNLLSDGLKSAITAFISGVASIKIEVGQESTQCRPETPHDVMVCDDYAFRNLIYCHKDRLTAAFGPTACNDIWKQRLQLTERYNTDSSFRRLVDGVTSAGFTDAWAVVDGERKYDLLVAFLAGLAAISPGTHTVESEFSLLMQIKNSQRSSLSNYAMEGQLQAQQYFILVDLADRVAREDSVPVGLS